MMQGIAVHYFLGTAHLIDDVFGFRRSLTILALKYNNNLIIWQWQFSQSQLSADLNVRAQFSLVSCGLVVASELVVVRTKARFLFEAFALFRVLPTHRR